MAKSFGANKLFILRTITFYSILPFVFSSLRIAVGRGLAGLIVGEAFGYGKGLGFLVSFYGNTFQTPRLMFVILVLLIISFILINLIGKSEKRVIKWKK
jgi:NitT/TauT family transport system permease protein